MRIAYSELTHYHVLMHIPLFSHCLLFRMFDGTGGAMESYKSS